MAGTIPLQMTSIVGDLKGLGHQTDWGLVGIYGYLGLKEGLTL